LPEFSFASFGFDVLALRFYLRASKNGRCHG